MHLRAEALEDGNGLRIGLQNWRRHRSSSIAARNASEWRTRGVRRILARRARGMQSSRAGTDKAESGQREIVTVLDHSISAGRTSASDLP